MARYTIENAHVLESVIRRKIDFAMRKSSQDTEQYAILASPRWTGAFVNSWRLNRGGADTSYVPQPQPWQSNKGAYGLPAPHTLSISLDLEDVYLTNSGDYSEKIWNYGTQSIKEGSGSPPMRAPMITAMLANLDSAIKAARGLFS